MLTTLMPSGLRPREPRTRVVVPCRLNLKGSWSDGCIHNVSSRGLLIASDNPPPQGSYVDIRRGSLVIIARVAWQRDRFFGVRTQDRISVESLISEPRRASAPAGSAERRAQARHMADAAVARRIERHRQLSSLFQYGSIAGVAAATAVFGAIEVHDFLSRSLDPVRTALGG
jgi:hypothetical protein